ncbi:MAG: Wzz/FepE/Etk N-terminal domain-containing protein, partial [Ruminococcus sp.]
HAGVWIYMRKTQKHKTETREKEINIFPLLKELVKKLWLIILVGLIVGGAFFLGTKLLIKPSYRSGFTAYVNNKQGKQATDYLTVSDVNAAKELVLTYSNIITSKTILTNAAKKIGVDLPYDVLARMVSTESKDETEIISVYVVDTDPQLAYDYAQTIAKIAPVYIAEIVEGSSMKIIDLPEYSDKRYKPSYLRYAIIGFLIGALLVVAFVIIRFFIDDTVKNEGDVEKKFALPILGVIPDVNSASSKGSDYYSYENNNKNEQVDISENDLKNEEENTNQNEQVNIPESELKNEEEDK